MGDRADPAPFPAGVDRAKIDAAVEAAFSNPDALTAAFLVVHKGQSELSATRRTPNRTAANVRKDINNVKEQES